MVSTKCFSQCLIHDTCLTTIMLCCCYCYYHPVLESTVWINSELECSSQARVKYESERGGSPGKLYFTPVLSLPTPAFYPQGTLIVAKPGAVLGLSHT